MSEELVGEILELPQTDYQKQMPGEEEEAVAQATEISIESVEEGSVQFQDEVSAVKQVLFQDQDDDSSSSDYGSHDKPGTVLQRLVPEGNVLFPDIFQTNQLLFYERFKAYQDYMLGDCRTSEVKDFTAEYLEKVLEPSGWQAVWRTDVFEVLIEVVDVEYLVLKAAVELVTPFLCETKGCELTGESMKDLLEAKEHKVPVQELYVVYDESGEFDQTALAVEHVRFFYKHIWRSWDEEDEDDDFDYFVRCVEPRLRLYYDILEDRVPSGLVAEYHCLVSQCEEKYKEFTSLRNNISNSDSESELDNISMVEGLKMYDDLESLKRKLKIIENPLLRYVLGYQVNSGLQSNRAKGPRPTGERMVHVVSSSMTVSQLQTLMRDKLCADFSGEEFELQFHSDPLVAVNACYEGDVVVICPGHYSVNGSFSIPDSIELEGFGLTDEVVIEKVGKDNIFLDITGANVKVSNLKFVQHDAVEGILCVRQGKTVMENCVLQCETTGVTVRTSAELFMNICDLYGAKGAGVEIYPGSTCSLVGNGIHHCKEGILIKDFTDEFYTMPKITMMNNVIHNNEGYGVILVKPADLPRMKKTTEAGFQDESKENGGQKKEADEEEVPSAEGYVEGNNLFREPHTQEHTEGNDVITNELVATSSKKSQLQKKKMIELGLTKADDDLMSQEMFVSINGNHFKRNGKGSFGTFFY
ncbi:SHC SH2 domain-binding protein 1-like isoform X1 [Acipenser oxyrinchus oxyrinchus]|uniref:SHC SH2 domain-binding protein 1 n=1 Tax=Acipenser oxyrinchus oxyrinchus TaxID=40147 RepID=A0AAD8G4E3_ACIOX|nr:SHC SH2 domain-binding protein 1-like isoform X1 [Acipenser oxyrinchus oxyrinchus]